MRTLFSVILLLSHFWLFSQPHCDTLKINTAMAHAKKLLAEGKAQPAIDAVQYVLYSLTNCPDLDSAFRESIFPQVAECYRAVSDEFLYEGMINKGIDIKQRTIALYHQMTGDNSDQIATAYTELAKAYALNDNRKMSIEQSINGLKIRQLHDPLSKKIPIHYDQIVGNYLAMGDVDNGRLYLDEWEKFHHQPGYKIAPQVRVSLANNWASWYYEKGDIQSGIKVLEDTLALYGELLRGNGALASGLVGMAEFNLCEYYAVLGNYEKSLFYAEKNVALFELRLQQQRGKLFGQSHYAWCLGQSARAAWGLYRQTQDTAWYNFAERRSQQTEDLIFALRDRSPNDGFREWMGDDIDIVANIAEVRQGLYAKTGDKKHITRAFEAIEASKTFAMQQFLQETYALRWGGLPDSLFQLETKYRQEINDLESDFFMVRLQPNADSLIDANDQKLFALRDQYGVFLSNLEQNFPQYFRLKYSHPAVDLQQVQHKSLQPGQCFLDLYIRNDLVFALLIRPDTMVWLTTPYDSTAHYAIERLKAESQHFPEYQNLSEQAYLKELQSFADAAYRAYQVLIAPIRPMLLEEVILIPRNDLATLPFGALLTQKETNMGKPFLWHFLDNELVLSKTFSIGMFQFVENRPTGPKPAGSVLALAPFNDAQPTLPELPIGDVAALRRGSGFAPLPYSGTEALAITQLTKGQALLGYSATKTNFLKKSPDFKIIHLASHSVANDVLGEYSFVALQGDDFSGEMDMLYARDIYGLRLSADLVVLSSCESGLGQYRNGEGIVGLSRAFICAGTRNVVASLWSVNDASTKNLMVSFYKEINQGKPYNRALTDAKRAFIQENRQYAHPYYWAGFGLNGR